MAQPEIARPPPELAAELDLRVRPLRDLSDAERAELVALAGRWGEAHVYQHPGFVLAAAHAGRRPPIAIELRAADGGLRGYWLAYWFDRAAIGPLGLSVAWARGLPVAEPELRRDPAVLPRFVDALEKAMRHPGRLAVMVTTEPEVDAAVESALRGRGFERQDLSSVMVDLTKPEEDLWAAIGKSARYAIKKGQRDGVELRVCDRREDFEVLASLLMQTYAQGGVGYRLPVEEIRAYRDLALAGGGRLTLAYFGGEPAGATFEVILGDRSLTHLWTTTDLGRKQRAGDVMVWETMRLCKSDGLRWLDLGTVKTEPEPNSKAAGIYAFKTKWGGQMVPTPFYRYSSPLDRLVQRLRRLRGPSGVVC